MKHHRIPAIFGFLILVLCGMFLTGSGISAPSSAEMFKFQVADHDLAIRLQQEFGARLIADYGAYCLLEIDRASLPDIKDLPGFQNRSEYDFVTLNTGWLSTRGSYAPQSSGVVEVFSGKRLHLVQFTGPVQPEWYHALTGTGAGVVTYIPHNAYLLYLDSSALSRLKTLAASRDFIQWEGDYLPDYIIQPGALAEDRQKSGQPDPDAYTVQLVRDAGANTETVRLVDQFRQGNLLQDYDILQYRNVTAPLPESCLMDLAVRPDVVSILPWYTPRMSDERQDQIMANHLAGNVPSGAGYLTWLLGLGFTQQQFTTSGFAVDVTDSGIDNATTSPNHFALYVNGTRPGTSRVAYNRTYGSAGASAGKGCDGHGNLNSHIVAGYNTLTGSTHEDTSGYNYGLGVCPWVKVGSSVIFDPNYTYPPSWATLQSDAYASGARISTNSWGQSAYGAYNSDAQAYDALVRDAQTGTAGNQEMVITFSAGNDGSSSGSAGAPGTAKNVFTIGASENVHPFGGADQCSTADSEADNANDIATFSSRGPCDDGRVKPDIQAPGTHISGGVAQIAAPPTAGTADACFSASGVCGGPAASPKFWPAGQQWTTASSGTSHSCPAMAGASALLRQWFANKGWTPAPSPAMNKAFLMNSTRYMTGTGANDTLPSNSQGMGEVDLTRAFDTASRVLVDEAQVFTAAGQNRVTTGTISDGSQPFRVTLAWTDPAGPTSGNAYVNNLDLTVTAGGQTYYGNVFSGQSSTTGGSPDLKNNVESVFLPAGVTGPYLVNVTATAINGDGVPGNGQPLDQDYALVIYNATEIQQPVIDSQSATLTVEGCVPGNGAPDPGEVVTYSFTLHNSGTAATTNLVATLQATGGVTSPGGSQTYGAIAPGASASQPFSFIIDPNLACGDQVTATLHLMDGATDLGSVAFPFTTGVLTPVVVIFSENFDGAAVPALPAGWAVVDTAGSTGDWLTATATVHPSGVAPQSAPNLIYFNSYSATSGNNTRLYRTTGLNLATYTGADITLNFYMYHETGYSYDDDRIQAQVSTNGGSSWIDAGAPVSRYNGSTGWARHTVSLSAYAGLADVRIALHGISIYGNDCHVDDLTVEARTRECCLSTLPKGDLDHDGHVNASDLLILADYLGGADLPAGTTVDECDLVVDAVIDAADLTWLINKVNGNI